MDHTNTKVIICYNFKRHVKLSKKQKLNIVSGVFFKNYFFNELKANVAEILPIKLSIRDYIGVFVSAPDPLFKTQLTNGIRIYSDKKGVIKISRLVNEFLLIWKLSSLF